MERNSESKGFIEKDGGKATENASILKLEQEGNFQPRLVVNECSGGRLRHNSLVNQVQPRLAEGSQTVVLLAAEDVSTWKKNCRGPRNIWRITFELKKDADRFISMYISLANDFEFGRSSGNPTPTSELEGLSLSNNAAAGECKNCWNQGVIGDKCDNCGETMKAVENLDDSSTKSFCCSHSSHSVDILGSDVNRKEESGDDEDDDEEEVIDFPNTQDWPDEPLMPFGAF